MSRQKDEAIYRKGWNDGFAKGAAAARFQLEAENAKLRELVRDSASLLDATCDTYYEDDYHAIIDRMRELGVEV